MNNRKIAQVQEALKREISKVVLYELADPRIGFMTITQVKLSRDLRSAEVSVSIRGDDAVRTATLSALAHARGHVQEKIAKRLPMRFTPMLGFVIDERIAKGLLLTKTMEEARRADDGLDQIDEELSGG